MFEDLRKEGESSPFFQQGDEPDPLLDASAKQKSGGSGLNIKMPRKFLGMTAFQRFFVSAALLVFVIIGGLAFLFATGSIVVF